jgi:hypothetical protein
MTTLPPSHIGGVVLKLERETAGVAHHFELQNLQSISTMLLELERETGFEPATSTLARLRSTN